MGLSTYHLATSDADHTPSLVENIAYYTCLWEVMVVVAVVPHHVCTSYPPLVVIDLVMEEADF